MIDSEQELISRATGLRALLEKNAAQSEAERRLVEENMRALDSAGLMEIMLPRRLGGQGASMATMLRASAELAKGCPSTAWVHAVMNISAWFATRASARLQQDIFRDTVQPRLCGSLEPTKTVRAVEGGAIVSGRWDFTSGCWHANWCICGVPIADAAGNFTDVGWAFIPMAQLKIVDSWYVAGMKGTGSCMVVADELFVPAHRLMSLRGEHVDQDWMTRNRPEPCDFWPLKPVLVLGLIGPILGMAEGALEAVAAQTQTRGIKYTVYTRKSDSPVVQHHFAKAALMIDSARFHILRAAADVDRAGEGVEMDPIVRARVRGDCGYASDLAREAVELLVSIAGGTAFPETGQIQRYWRDIGVASRHASLTAMTDFEIYGRVLLGRDSNITHIV
ncbi:MAG TPA: acyl-CoA dehydrogenase family protein [Candidatus Binataceae bacterium]|nr:acyl-CoA dehydrogenase family protein [Candidatus Binataceae bacterium]